MKKIILSILTLVLFFLIPSALAEEPEVVSYQKLKNITKSDHPAGSNLTMGFLGDEIRFLIFVQNKSEDKETFRVESILPEGLVYQPNTTYRYQLGSGGSWQKVPDKEVTPDFPLQSHIINIEPDVGFYFKFSTIVADDIPANNLTLSNFVRIYNSANKVVKQTVTKVLVPNSTIKQVEAQNDSIDEEYVNKILQEEQKFIEKTFFELGEKGFEAELPKKEVLAINKSEQAQEEENASAGLTLQDLKQVSIYIVAVILLLGLLFFMQSKFGSDK